MLVLMRRDGESIVCRTKGGEVIEIVIVKIERNRARVGVNAPLSITVDRQEIDALKHPELANGNVA